MLPSRMRRPRRCQGEQADHDPDGHGGTRDRPVHRQVDERLPQGCRSAGHSPGGTLVAQDGGQGAAHEPGSRAQRQHDRDRSSRKEGPAAPTACAAAPQGGGCVH